MFWWYLFAILLPFLAVLFKTKKLVPTLIAFGLTWLAWLPGAIYAIYVVHKYSQDGDDGEEEITGV